ncbi:uncharacterized protein LOC121736345 [Aricia agestis]|uniref:uncharacterized protein LOC121736345 n=1 Tax=Aricia agestis TaxID=91739 RepID=UPI001C20538D|nr:uncharacterized protein LOC121736345 [Aricia agestis]
MKNDDEEEYIVNSAGVARYPCMPSEAALAQMRNRMQLAKLGKKLMKWTALASSREMRVLGQELKEAYENLHEKLHEAYIILARSRYFNPNLNSIVTENVDKNAAVLVESRLKPKSGVKVMLREIKKTNCEPYTFLGIEKGGEIIMEAKKQWHEIIRLLILITQLRAVFLAVDKANKAANKKKNVFTRIILPRTMETIAYIESGLEELAREDFFRLRRFIYKKRSTSPNYQERKPIEIKEKLLPKASKRIYKIECFMCGAFLRFSLVDEREKYLERRKIEALRFQMNEMLLIAKKLEEQGIVGINVDEFIVTAEKLKERLNESPHLDQLCRKCKELLKKKQAKENQGQKLQQIEQDVKTESIPLKSELTPPTIGTAHDKNDEDKALTLGTSTQDLKVKQIDEEGSLKLLNANERERGNKVSEIFTENRDTEGDFTHLKGRSVESTRKEISTITITKELTSQSLLDSPLETSVEKIKKVVTDEKENKVLVEEKFIITIKEKIKSAIRRITKSSETSKTSLDEGNEMTQSTTVIKIDSRLSSEPIRSENSSHSGLAMEVTKSKEPVHLPSSTDSKDQIVNDERQNVNQSKEIQPTKEERSSESPLNISCFSSFFPNSKINENKSPTPPRSTSFTDVTTSDTKIKEEIIKKSTSLPFLHLSIEKLPGNVEQTNDLIESSHLPTDATSSKVPENDKVIESCTELIHREAQSEDNVDNSEISTDTNTSENEKKVHMTYNMQITEGERNGLLTSMETSRNKTPNKRDNDDRTSHLTHS